MVKKEDNDSDEPTFDPSPVDPLTREEFEELLGAAKTPREKLTLVLLWHTGMRVSTVMNFTRDWFDEENQIIRVKNSKLKSADDGEQWREILLSDKATDKLRFLLNQVDDERFGVSPAAIRSRIHWIADQTENITAPPRLFRRSFIIRLAKAGLTPNEIRRLSVHNFKPEFQRTEEPDKPSEDTTVKDVETLERGIDKFISANEHTWRETTAKRHRYRLTSFSEWSERVTTDQETVEWPRPLTSLIDEYLDKRSEKVAPATLEHTESILRCFERWWNSHGQNV